MQLLDWPVGDPSQGCRRAGTFRSGFQALGI